MNYCEFICPHCNAEFMSVGKIDLIESTMCPNCNKTFEATKGNYNFLRCDNFKKRKRITKLPFFKTIKFKKINVKKSNKLKYKRKKFNKSVDKRMISMLSKLKL